MSNLHGWLSKISAILIGLMMFALTFVINIIGTNMLTWRLHSVSQWTWSASNYPLVIDFQRVHEVFLYVYPAGVCIATVFFFWKGLPPQALRIALYVLLLALVGPLTFINYQMSDQWLNLWIQAGFNIFVAFVGYVLVLRIREIRAKSADAKALQSISILLITSMLVALPLFYTAIFLAVSVHLVDHKGVQAISEKIPLAVAGIVGILAVLLNNLESLRDGAREAKQVRDNSPD